MQYIECHIGDKGIEFISEVLSNHKTITDVSLECKYRSTTDGTY
jgi:hypothetical protein